MSQLPLLLVASIMAKLAEIDVSVKQNLKLNHFPIILAGKIKEYEENRYFFIVK